jgi:glycosyltransferase involved in cell wall biosynthesis
MRLAQELRRRGHEAAIFTRAPARPHPEAPAIPVFAADGPAALVIAERLRRQLARFAPSDVIIQYTPQMLGAWRWGSPAALWLADTARRLGANVVLLAHELFIPWRWRPDLASGAALMRAELAVLLKAVHRALVTMGTRVAELAPFTRLLRLPRPGVVRVGSNALPLSAARRSGGLRLGVFSTLASTKRFDVVLDCFREVHARRPDAELVLLGDLRDSGDAQARALSAEVARHPAAARIRVPGRLELSEVAREVAGLDVYLFPMISGANTRSSTLPVAFGAGLPVVATRSYETDELFVADENIVFADALTGSSFAAAVGRLGADPALADRVSVGARRLYSEHLSWEKIGDQLLAQI